MVVATTELETPQRRLIDTLLNLSRESFPATEDDQKAVEELLHDLDHWVPDHSIEITDKDKIVAKRVSHAREVLSQRIIDAISSGEEFTLRPSLAQETLDALPESARTFAFKSERLGRLPIHGMGLLPMPWINGVMSLLQREGIVTLVRTTENGAYVYKPTGASFPLHENAEKPGARWRMRQFVEEAHQRYRGEIPIFDTPELAKKFPGKDQRGKVTGAALREFLALIYEARINELGDDHEEFKKNPPPVKRFVDIMVPPMSEFVNIINEKIQARGTFSEQYLRISVNEAIQYHSCPSSISTYIMTNFYGPEGPDGHYHRRGSSGPQREAVFPERHWVPELIDIASAFITHPTVQGILHGVEEWRGERE